MSYFQFRRVVLVFVFVLTGCGGGGSANTGFDTDFNLLKGNVIDGPLVGAKVCLDLNSNWVCDIGEPSTISVAKGKYILDISPRSKLEIGDKFVIAEIENNVFDEETGKTIEESGMTPYVLASWGGPSPMLTVLNTFAAAQYLGTGSKDLKEAYNLERIAQLNQLFSTNVNYYEENTYLFPNEKVFAKLTGRVLANALSAAHARLNSQAASVYNSNKSGKGLRAVQLVIQSLVDTQPSSYTESESEKITRLKNYINFIPISPEKEKLIRQIPKLLSVDNSIKILKQGLSDVAFIGNTPASIQQISLKNMQGSLTAASYISRNSTWIKDSNINISGASGYHLLYQNFISNPNGQDTVISNSIRINSPVITSENGILYEKYTGETNAPKNEISILYRDAGGIRYTSLPELNYINGQFSGADYLYIVRRKASANFYLFDTVVPFFNSLSEFRMSPRTCSGGICWSFGGIDEINFSTTSDTGSLDLGTGYYSIKLFDKYEIMVVSSVPIEVQNRSQLWSAKDGRKLIFSDFDEKLWAGKFAPESSIWYSNHLLAQDTLSTVLQAAQLPVFQP